MKKINNKIKRKLRNRKKLKTANVNRLRISITKSLNNLSAQIIDDKSNKTIVSASSMEKDLRKDKKNKTNDDKDKKDKEYVDLIAQLKVVLGDQVKDIRLSSKLTDSPVCLVADEGDMDIAMEQLMAQRDSNYKGALRILEINGDHSLIKNMKSLLSKKESNDLVSDAGTLLFEQARLMEGKMPADPAQFSKIMNQFLLKAIPN